MVSLTPHWTLFTVHCSLHTSTLYSEHRTLFNVHCTQLYYSLHHCGQSSLHTAHTIFAAPVCVGLILHLFAPSGDLYAMATVLVNIWHIQQGPTFSDFGHKSQYRYIALVTQIHLHSVIHTELHHGNKGYRDHVHRRNIPAPTFIYKICVQICVNV